MVKVEDTLSNGRGSPSIRLRVVGGSIVAKSRNVHERRSFCHILGPAGWHEHPNGSRVLGVLRLICFRLTWDDGQERRGGKGYLVRTNKRGLP